MPLTIFSSQKYFTCLKRILIIIIKLPNGSLVTTEFKLPLQKYFSHVIHIINRLPTHFLQNKSPFHVLHQYLPDIYLLKVFGSLSFASTLQAHRKKLDSRSKKYTYLGLQVGVKGHILFDLKSEEIFLSKYVIFFESIFPYKYSKHTSFDSHSSSLNPLYSHVFFSFHSRPSQQCHIRYSPSYSSS